MSAGPVYPYRDRSLDHIPNHPPGRYTYDLTSAIVFEPSGPPWESPWAGPATEAIHHTPKRPP